MKFWHLVYIVFYPTFVVSGNVAYSYFDIPNPSMAFQIVVVILLVEILLTVKEFKVKVVFKND